MSMNKTVVVASAVSLAVVGAAAATVLLLQNNKKERALRIEAEERTASIASLSILKEVLPVSVDATIKPWHTWPPVNGQTSITSSSINSNNIYGSDTTIPPTVSVEGKRKKANSKVKKGMEIKQKGDKVDTIATTTTTTTTNEEKKEDVEVNEVRASIHLTTDELTQVAIHAKKGNVIAQTNMALIRYHGLDGNAADTKVAQTWLEKAAKRNHPRAQALLGILYVSHIVSLTLTYSLNMMVNVLM
jgi:hypothetical protein